MSQGHLGYHTFIPSVLYTERLHTILLSFPSQCPKDIRDIPHIFTPSHVLRGYNPTILPNPLSQGHLGYPTFSPSVPCTGKLYIHNPTLLSIPLYSKDTWDIPHLSHLSQGYLGYPTAIPSNLSIWRLQSYCPFHPTIPRTLGISQNYLICLEH